MPTSDANNAGLQTFPLVQQKADEHTFDLPLTTADRMNTTGASTMMNKSSAARHRRIKTRTGKCFPGGFAMPKRECHDLTDRAAWLFDHKHSQYR